MTVGGTPSWSRARRGLPNGAGLVVKQWNADFRRQRRCGDPSGKADRVVARSKGFQATGPRAAEAHVGTYATHGCALEQRPELDAIARQRRAARRHMFIASAQALISIDHDAEGHPSVDARFQADVAPVAVSAGGRLVVAASETGGEPGRGDASEPDAAGWREGPSRRPSTTSYRRTGPLT